jgi:hypothetical protein
MRSEENRSEASFVLREASEHARLLQEWRACQVTREFNSITNDLAHLARRSGHSDLWLGRAPSRVTDQVELEQDCISKLPS